MKVKIKTVNNKTKALQLFQCKTNKPKKEHKDNHKKKTTDLVLKRKILKNNKKSKSFK
jgi:hypothetical protein